MELCQSNKQLFFKNLGMLSNRYLKIPASTLVKVLPTYLNVETISYHGIRAISAAKDKIYVLRYHAME